MSFISHIVYLMCLLVYYFIYAFYAMPIFLFMLFMHVDYVLSKRTTVSKTKPKYQFRRGVKMVKENFTLV